MSRSAFTARILIWVVLLTAGLAATAVGQAVRPFDPKAMPEVVAKVNGREIYRSELLTQADVIRGQARQSGQQDPGRLGVEFYREVLDGLIGEMLVYDDAVKRGVGASEAEIDAAIKGLEGKYPDAAAFDQALSEQNTSRDQLRQQLEQTLSIEKVVRQEIASQVEVTAEIKRQFYDQNLARFTSPERRRVRHILRRVAPTASAGEKAAAKNLAGEILKRLRAGEDFTELVARHSEDSESRDGGGELPWVVMNDRQDSPFYTAIAGLSVGELSEVVETEAGFHVVELLEVSPARTRPYAEVEEGIGSYLQESMVFGEVQRRVGALRAQAEIELAI